MASSDAVESALPTMRFRVHGRTVCAVFFVLLSSLSCFAGDVVLIRSAGGPSREQKQLEIATQFYGLNLQIVTIGATSATPLLSVVQQNSTLAVAIEANALAAVNQKALLRDLDRRSGQSVPLLILGITSDTDPALLAAWSGGAVVGSKHLAKGGALHYVIGSVAGITDQLTNLEIPLPGDETFYFASAEGSTAQEIIAVRNDHQAVRTFLEASLGRQKVFLLCKRPLAANAAETSADNVITAFAEVAPAMIFARYSAGARGWHALHHYANFTIDDPWLREPYGFLAYKGLLKEMERHDFHTTIAFIPWNYDRSEAELVALFRRHPERFSICVHGDNHDHREFDDLASKPLNVQTAALEQSLARMEEFQTLTGIPYDHVFVFPHNIGSESILEKLKAFNFTATVNAGNVPMDRPRPQSPLFALRPVTLTFGDFPSIDRFTAGMPNPSAFIRINEFLDNPLFFYAHQEFFASGIDAFDGLADDVNHIAPGTQWRSVGDIAKHLYLIRERDDAGYDVLTFSRSFDLENPFGRDLIFHVQKQESGFPPIASVSADGQQIPFELRGGVLEISVPVRAGKVLSVVIDYKNNLDLASVSIAKSSFRVYILRKVSDFRDITLSKSSIGRGLTDFYYKHALSPATLIVCGCSLILFGGWGTWRLVLLFKRTGKSKVVSRANASPIDPIARATRDSCIRS